MRSPLFLAAAAVLFGVALDAGAANATCKRFGFTVNDYGKEGPTKDAKDLLDKHIAEWAAEQKIKDYKTGKKDVNCELFLNFVVFDEHTCTASANVCWNDGKGSSTPDAASPDEAEAGIPPTPIRKASLTGHDKKTATAAKAQPPVAETPPASPPADTAADTAADTPPADAPPAATEPTSPPPAAQPAKAAETTPPPTSPPPAIVETGTLPKDPLSALKKHAAVAPDVAPAPVKSVDAVPDVPPAATAPVKPADKRDPAAASAAATAAAAAAERAAVAAETAAAAAKEAAAAAVAASAASKGGVVPPLDP